MISYNKSKTILKKSLINLGEEHIETSKCLNRVTSKGYICSIILSLRK